MIVALLLAQATTPVTADPFAALKSTVVDAIRDCGTANNVGEIRVCSRDRGFAEGGGKRLPKLVKPKPVERDPAITFEVSGANAPPPDRTTRPLGK